MPHRIFGDSLLAASGASQVPTNERAQKNFLHSHTDGVLSYGDRRPDYFFFICGSQGAEGGASIFTDGVEVLESVCNGNA